MNSRKEFASVDEYIAACPEETRERLRAICAEIKRLAPNAKEKISYQIAAFELNGKNLIHFAGWKNHISIYPIPGGAKREVFEKEVSRYVDGKGTLKFPLNQPLPIELIAKVVKLHKANILEKTVVKLDEK